MPELFYATYGRSRAIYFHSFRKIAHPTEAHPSAWNFISANTIAVFSRLSHDITRLAPSG